MESPRDRLIGGDTEDFLDCLELLETQEDAVAEAKKQADAFIQKYESKKRILATVSRDFSLGNVYPAVAPVVSPDAMDTWKKRVSDAHQKDSDVKYEISTAVKSITRDIDEDNVSTPEAVAAVAVWLQILTHFNDAGKYCVKQTRDHEGPITTEAEIAKRVKAAGNQSAGRFAKLERRTGPGKCEWLVMFRSDAINGGEDIFYASSAMLHDIFGEDYFNATALVPACYEKNLNRLRMSLRRDNTLSFGKLSGNCQLYILKGVHTDLALTAGASEVKYKDGWTGMQRLGNLNYYNPSESYRLHQEQQAHALAQAAPAGTSTSANTDEDLSAGLSEEELFMTSRQDLRGDPPIPLNGMSELTAPSRALIFERMQSMPVDWQRVLRKTRHKLDPQAIGFMEQQAMASTREEGHGLLKCALQQAVPQDSPTEQQPDNTEGPVPSIEKITMLLLDAVIIHTLELESGAAIDSRAFDKWETESGETGPNSAMRAQLSFPETTKFGSTATLDLYKPKKGKQVTIDHDHRYAAHPGHECKTIEVVNAVMSAGGRERMVNIKTGKEAKCKILKDLQFDETDGTLFSSVDDPSTDALKIKDILEDTSSKLRPTALKAATELQTKAGKSLQDTKVVTALTIAPKSHPDSNKPTKKQICLGKALLDAMQGKLDLSSITSNSDKLEVFSEEKYGAMDPREATSALLEMLQRGVPRDCEADDLFAQPEALNAATTFARAMTESQAFGLICCSGEWSTASWKLFHLLHQCLLSGQYSPPLAAWKFIAHTSATDLDDPPVSTQSAESDKSHASNAPEFSYFSWEQATKLRFMRVEAEHLSDFMDKCNRFAETWLSKSDRTFSKSLSAAEAAEVEGLQIPDPLAAQIKISETPPSNPVPTQSGQAAAAVNRPQRKTKPRHRTRKLAIGDCIGEPSPADDFSAVAALDAAGPSAGMPSADIFPLQWGCSKRRMRMVTATVEAPSVEEVIISASAKAGSKRSASERSPLKEKTPQRSKVTSSINPEPPSPDQSRPVAMQPPAEDGQAIGN